MAVQPSTGRYKLTLPRYKLTLGQNNSVQSQYVQTLRRLSSVSETWWGDLQGFHFANSTVRASLHLSGNPTEAAPREDAVIPENLCSCTCKPVKLYSFSPKHSCSGRNIILICHGKGTDELKNDARRAHESSISPIKCMHLCATRVPSNSNSSYSVFMEHPCFRAEEKRVCHNVMYSHFFPSFFFFSSCLQ